MRQNVFDLELGFYTPYQCGSPFLCQGCPSTILDTMPSHLSVKYSILVNGQSRGLINPTRGLRQGDSLSPYMFLLCAEGLSALLNNVESQGLIKGVVMTKGGSRINHLLLADDCLIFCGAEMVQWQVLKGILQSYEVASGQKVNLDKTSLFFSSNTRIEVQDLLTQSIGARHCTDTKTYLGLPSVVGKAKYRVFSSIKGRIEKRIKTWHNKFLSQAGKKVLIKSVLQSLPTYAMSLFLLPSKLCKVIYQLLSRFWWDRMANQRRVQWYQWKKVIVPKNQGCLGFRDMESFNLALLAKQFWRIVTRLASFVAQILHDKYFKDGDLMHATTGGSASFIWKSLTAAKALVMDGMRWRVGNGKHIKIWYDKWLPTPHSYKVQSPIKLLHHEATVDNLLTVEGRWKEELVDEIFSIEAAIIKGLPVSRRGSEDKLFWSPSRNGQFSMKYAYYLQC